MSPHTDAGALLKLIDGIEKRAFDIPASNLVTPQIVQMCIAARNILTRQAASQGSAGGGRPEVRSEVVAWQKRRNDYARGEWIQVLPEHVDEAKSRGWQVRPLYAAPQPAIAAQAPIDSDKEATFGEDGYNPAYDDGITFAIVQLAELTGSKDWQMRDGSEDHDTDIRDTIMDVLKCAELYDDETGKFAALAQAQPSREAIARIINGVAFRPTYISGEGLTETQKEKYLRARNVAYYQADCILAEFDKASPVPSASSPAQARQERHEVTYLRGWNEGIECAVEALEKEGWYTPQDTIRKLVEASPVPSAHRGGEV